MKRITMKLRTPLQDSEVAKIGNELADKITELERVREERTIMYKQYKEKVTGLNEIISEYADRVHNKSFAEDVECEIRPLPGSKRVEIIRLDTGESIESRPMTDEEKQQEFDWDASPEESAKNAKAFLKKKGDVAENLPSNEGEKEATDDEQFDGKFINDGTDPSNPENEIGDIESGESFPKNQVKEVKIKFDKDLDFGAVIKVAQDEGEGFHFGYRIASTRSPKASHAVNVLVDSVTYTEYSVMLRQAALAMTGKLTGDPKFRTMGVDRVNRITAVIDDFCSEELTQAVAAD